MGRCPQPAPSMDLDCARDGWNRLGCCPSRFPLGGKRLAGFADDATNRSRRSGSDSRRSSRITQCCSPRSTHPPWDFGALGRFADHLTHVNTGASAEWDNFWSSSLSSAQLVHGF